MKNSSKIALILVIFIAGFGHVLYAQSNYKIDDSKDIDMKLSGTSTLHNWVMNARIVSGEAQFDFKEGNDNQLTALRSLTFSLMVRNLKSDSKGLDKNAYKALNTNQHKNISYKLISATIAPVTENEYLLKTHGNLTIAGVTKEIVMSVYCHVNNDGIIMCNGSYKLNMTDYQVNPPTFMVGAMKTGDSVTLEFNMTYQKLKGN